MRSMSRFVYSSTLALSILGIHCNTDAAVFVAPTVESPTLTVEKAALGTKLTGTFKLKLHLSARASGPSQVTLSSFSLKSADQKTTYVDPLPFSADKSAPIAVAENSDTLVVITVDTGANLLPSTVHDTICGGGQVVVTGILVDSLQTSSTTFESDAFAPTGC